MRMEPLKIPRMTKAEYDALVERQYVSRIAFIGKGNPYIAPFMYVFDKKYLYFLSSRYGRKMEYFAANPQVSVEIEEYTPELSSFTFVSLQGMLREVHGSGTKNKSTPAVRGDDQKTEIIIECTHGLRLLFA